MGHQNAHYLKLKGKTYYFSRRVPKPLQAYTSVTRVELCLRTSVKSSALRQSMLLNADLEDQWSILRRQSLSKKLQKIFGTKAQDLRPAYSSVTYEGPKLSAALETYLRLKGAGRPNTFETGSRRAVGYLLDVTADKPIDAFFRSEANALREYLRGRGLAQESIARNLTSIRAVVNFVLKEEGLPPNQAFSGVYLGEPESKKKRYVPTLQELKKLQLLCRKADDELRWLLALISDTGLRLSEALGLCREDVVLEGETSYIRIEPKPWRRLKTSESQRDVPLVGAALWAVERAMDQVETKFLFPAYCSTAAVKSNSASASLNKWLKTNVSKEAVVHSMRHLMRDRLRQVGCPSEVIDAIGGWAQRSIGEKYGSGYDLAHTATWLKRCVEGEY